MAAKDERSWSFQPHVFSQNTAFEGRIFAEHRHGNRAKTGVGWVSCISEGEVGYFVNLLSDDLRIATRDVLDIPLGAQQRRCSNILIENRTGRSTLLRHGRRKNGTGQLLGQKSDQCRKFAQDLPQQKQL